MIIDTSVTAIVTPSVVPCYTCKQPVPQCDAWPVNLIVPSGRFKNGKQVWRATGEKVHLCDSCFQAEGDETETELLPQRLSLAEDGEWEQPSWSRNPDDEEFITYGWRARTYEGKTYVNHKEKAIVQRWLAAHGYVDTGDGHHYEQRA
jgi:hypothetical protein